MGVAVPSSLTVDARSERGSVATLGTLASWPLSSSPGTSPCTWSPLAFSEPLTDSSAVDGQDCRQVWGLSNAEQIRRAADVLVLVGGFVVFVLGFLLVQAVRP